MAQEIKDPFTRLLDLTLGWGEYVEETQNQYGDCVRAEDIHAIHQSVAEFADPYWDAPAETQERAVKAFLESRLLPLLLGRTPNADTGGASRVSSEKETEAGRRVAA